jgi:hypothetical protein
LAECIATLDDPRLDALLAEITDPRERGFEGPTH